MKGKMVNIPLLFDLEVQGGDTVIFFMNHSLVDCRAQQTFRVFLTIRIFNIIPSKPIIGRERVFAWNKIGLVNLIVLVQFGFIRRSKPYYERMG